MRLLRLSVAALALAWCAGANAGLLNLTYDLNQGSISPTSTQGIDPGGGEFFYSGILSFAPQPVPPSDTLVIALDFLGEQRLVLTDAAFFLPEAMFRVWLEASHPYRGPVGLLTLTYVGLADTDPPLDSPNPADEKTCFQDTFSTRCQSGPWPDLTAGSVTFSGLNLSFLAPPYSPALSGFLTFHGISFEAMGDSISIQQAPAPGNLALLAIALAGLGLGRRLRPRAHASGTSDWESHGSSASRERGALQIGLERVLALVQRTAESVGSLYAR